ncbi:MAG: radical SAM protein [Anaerolineales bacterium]|nr:MAG: radical SAM protein [Anaerolineales bacterium]
MTTLSPYTIIRPEPDGALLFQQETAETALLDLEGLDALYFLLEGGLREYPVLFVKYLRDQQFVVPGPSDGALETVERVRDVARQTTAPPRSLAAPETIHFSVTGRCDQACTGCFYSARPGSAVAAQDAPWPLFERVILEAEQARVLQIALGGGEPLLHPRLVDMVRLAREHSVVPNLTTNGNLLTREMAHALKEAGLGQAQISLNGADEAVNARTRPNFAATMQAIENCRAAGLRWGLNFLVTRSNLAALETVVALGRRLGAASVNILRPKPPTTTGVWLERESLDRTGYRAMQKVLHKFLDGRRSPDRAPETSNPQSQTRLTLDASLSFLLTDQPPDHLYRSGVWGCCAARKFVTVTQDGAVLPCSHVRWSDVGEGDFMHAWWQSEVFAWFREQEEMMRGLCRACPYLELCKGCRAVVMAFGGDFADSDPHCPFQRGQPNSPPRLEILSVLW